MQESILSASSSSSHILTLHFIIGCIYILRIYLTMSFICAVVILFCTSGSEVKSKWGLSRYYLAAFRVCDSVSLSYFLFKAFFKCSFYCMRESRCCAVTIAFIWATSPRGVVMKDVNILGSVKIFWFKVIGSLGFLSSACPCANTQRTPMEQAPEVCQCRHSVVLYFWLKMGFILLYLL